MSTFERNFWQEYERFLKTPLVTELPHPRTAALSQLAQEDVLAALRLLFSLDLEVLARFNKIDLSLFKKDIQAVLKQGGRIFLVGCGASGRMAMQLEYLWRQQHPDSVQVQAVMAGGDIALIESVEDCEDQPQFAIRHLQQLNLTEQDLVIGLSAGGESPFILAAVDYALTIGKVRPWLLFGNAVDVLLSRNPQHVVARCQDLYLDVGPMALTGSTRMQATTIMTLSLLMAFFDIQDELNIFAERLQNLPLVELAEFIIWEAEMYCHKQLVLYQVPAVYGLSVLADTTERSPTFNLPTFESEHKSSAALTYLVVQGALTKKSAWQQLLLRDVTALNWAELPQTLDSYVDGFDLSLRYQAHARVLVEFKDEGEYLEIVYAQGQKKLVLNLAGLSLPLRQLLVRLVLVNHSTLVFGRLGFYQGNLMTFVKPSNFKLVDRAVRYIQFLAKTRYQQTLDYKEVAEFVLHQRENLADRVSIVELALKYFFKG